MISNFIKHRCSLVFAVSMLLSFDTAVANEFFAESIPVDDRSQSSLDQAAEMAMTRMLIRVSGDETVVERPAFSAAVKKATRHLSLYSYRDSDTGTEAYFEFDDLWVRSLFREEGVPYWDERRPPIVVWLVVDEPFSRRFAARSDDPDVLTQSITPFADRGVTVRFPLLDLEDAAALPIDSAWSRDTNRIRLATGRYNAEHALVGRWIALSDGSKLVDWTYVGPSSIDNRQLRTDNDERSWQLGIDLAVDSMRDQYAVTLQRFTDAFAIKVSVAGVSDYADYRAVTSLFDDLGELVDLRVDSVADDRLIYRVLGVSSAEEVVRLIPERSGLRIDNIVSRNQLNLLWGEG
ncbi:MAG: hypothetical protein CNF01_02360 [Halieaceae bacterium MED-G27]|jgi:hypothetical protein|nr:hypothetical protein [Halieaceae bacterium]OUT64241.1 MAG: hypothetical protein CBB81_10150 [Cellvibrionales bacterium TMED21]PDH38084.1 MAG: hypothetical protein CNF01_02360 [Halieaceae bacterium MED-G27]|tara:strand:+ start:14798 stop:15844 length:1047 start_codon:yes stop_codon:yes gene_type:complete